MGSLIEELEERELAARKRVEELEALIAELSGQLEGERDVLARLQVTRETVAEVLTELSGREREAEPVVGADPVAPKVRVVGSIMVPHWREGLSSDVLPDLYRDIMRGCGGRLVADEGEADRPSDRAARGDRADRGDSSLVPSISEDSKRLTDHPYLADSVGQIASEYLPHIKRAMTDDPDRDTDRLFPVAGSEATMDHRNATRFLFTIGQSSQGYEAVEVGQKSYIANLMEYHMNPDLPAELRYSKNLEKGVDQIAYGSGEVSGALAIGRQEAVADPAEASDKAYGESGSQWKNAISGGTGTGIGVGTVYIASPTPGPP